MKSDTQKLAERITLLLQEGEREKPANDFSALQSGLEKINQRLDKIEIQLSEHVSTPTPSIPSAKSLHPSQEKFVSLEELADEIINSLQNEKACPYEPTGKPCDHCAMCNSRGF